MHHIKKFSLLYDKQKLTNSKTSLSWTLVTLYIVPSNTTMNLGFGKTFQRNKTDWTLSLFVDNIADELNIGRALANKISFDPGRTWRIQLKNRF